MYNRYIMYTPIDTHIPTYIHAHTHICACTHTHTHTHTRTHARNPLMKQPLLLTDDINVSMLDALHHCLLHILGCVQLTQTQKTGQAKPICQLQDADWVTLLNRGMIGVDVFKQCKKAVDVCVGDRDLCASIEKRDKENMLIHLNRITCIRRATAILEQREL